jgi:LAGLIDADG endonuclease
VLDAPVLELSDNASSADNQQERLSIESISLETGNYLAGFAHGEGSFMIVCRRRADYKSGWKFSAAFNVSQADRAPLELFQQTLK